MIDEKTKVDLYALGIIDLEQKRALECYVDERLFRQRKSFSEYYIDVRSVDVVIDIRDLMILSEQFDITISCDSVILRDI